MHVYSKSLGSVTVKSSEILGFTKVGMAIATPAIPLLPALVIQAYTQFYRIFLSVYDS